MDERTQKCSFLKKNLRRIEKRKNELEREEESKRKGVSEIEKEKKRERKEEANNAFTG